MEKLFTKCSAFAGKKETVGKVVSFGGLDVVPEGRVYLEWDKDGGRVPDAIASDKVFKKFVENTKANEYRSASERYRQESLCDLERDLQYGIKPTMSALNMFFNYRFNQDDPRCVRLGKQLKELGLYDEWMQDRAEAEKEAEEEMKSSLELFAEALGDPKGFMDKVWADFEEALESGSIVREGDPRMKDYDKWLEREGFAKYLLKPLPSNDMEDREVRVWRPSEELNDLPYAKKRSKMVRGDLGNALASKRDLWKFGGNVPDQVARENVFNRFKQMNAEKNEITRLQMKEFDDMVDDILRPDDLFDPREVDKILGL